MTDNEKNVWVATLAACMALGFYIQSRRIGQLEKQIILIQDKTISDATCLNLPRLGGNVKFNPHIYYNLSWDEGFKLTLADFLAVADKHVAQEINKKLGQRK